MFRRLERSAWSFHVVVLQRRAKKCTEAYNARAQLSFSSLNLLFGDVFVAVVFVVCLSSLIGPLHDPITWYKITHAGEQVAQWDFQNKGRSRWTGTSCFVLEVPLCNLLTSMCDFVPYDRIVQRAYEIFLKLFVWRSDVVNCYQHFYSNFRKC